jgi:flagellar hook-associated protein FlgK
MINIIQNSINGLTTQSRKIEQSALNISQADIKDVNLSEEIVNIVQSSQSYKANLKAISISSEMYDVLINAVSEDR